MNKVRLKTAPRNQTSEVGDIFLNSSDYSTDSYWILTQSNPAILVSIKSGATVKYENSVDKESKEWTNWRKLEKGETVEITAG